MYTVEGYRLDPHGARTLLWSQRFDNWAGVLAFFTTYALGKSGTEIRITLRTFAPGDEN